MRKLNGRAYSGLSRRAVLAGAFASFAGSQAAAYERCANTYAGPSCEVGLSPGRWESVYASQRASVWCWAATLEMLFKVYGHNVSQETIVETTYGQLVNLPAVDTAQIVALTNRDWVDDDGEEFTARLVAAYDARYNFGNINNAMIIEALRNEEPLVYCNQSHMMLLTALAYSPTPMGPNVYNLGFFDPWPGRGARGPDNAAELRIAHQGGAIMFIGQVNVS